MADVTMAVTPIVALDVPSSAAALQLVGELSELCRFYKIGGELYTAEGPRLVESVLGRGASVFLDLKFHDIPNTVRGAIKSAAALGVQMLTVHASGGPAMIRAAVEAARDARSSCEIFAVTVLTSLDRDALSSIWGRRIQDVEAEVLRLAELALSAGAAGIVCGGREAATVHAKFGSRLATVVPGVRLAGGDRHDQASVVTPREAASAGAKYIVVGRAITAAKMPRQAMSAILADLS